MGVNSTNERKTTMKILSFSQRGNGLLVVVYCFGVVAPAAAFQGSHFQGPHKVLPSFQAAVAHMKKVTRVPIVVPTNIAGKFQCFVDILAKNEYEVDLDMAGSTHDDEPSSLGAIASRKITGKKTAFSPLYGTRNYEFGSDEKAEAQPVILAHGIKGYFVNQDRGASLVFWRQGGYSYVVAYKGLKADVVGIANSAILNER